MTDKTKKKIQALLNTMLCISLDQINHDSCGHCYPDKPDFTQVFKLAHDIIELEEDVNMESKNKL